MVICENNNEIKDILHTLRNMKANHISNSDPYVKELKKSLRKLQRLSVYNRCRNDAVKLDNMMKYDKNKFWKKISDFKRYKNKQAFINSDQPSGQEFLKFYETLFSHKDRPSDVEHKKIEISVKNYAESISDSFYQASFKTDEVHEAILYLKSGKAAGIDNLTNEFLKAGCYDNLLNLIAIAFNAAYSSGCLSDDLNTSVLIPIQNLKKFLALQIIGLFLFRLPLTIYSNICSLLACRV